MLYHQTPLAPAVKKERGLVSRNVTIDGHRTSMRLEKNMWDALGEVSEREHVSIQDICTVIKRIKPKNLSLTSAIRGFLLDYFRNAATEEGHMRTGHGQQHARSLLTTLQDQQMY